MRLYDIKNTENAWIKIKAEVLDNGFLELTITDSGLPIPAHIKEKIFQPFYSSKPVGEGTGLGLSLSKGILNEHGGDLDLKDGDHPCFVLTFPLEKVDSIAS